MYPSDHFPHPFRSSLPRSLGAEKEQVQVSRYIRWIWHNIRLKQQRVQPFLTPLPVPRSPFPCLLAKFHAGLNGSGRRVLVMINESNQYYFLFGTPCVEATCSDEERMTCRRKDQTMINHPHKTRALLYHHGKSTEWGQTNERLVLKSVIPVDMTPLVVYFVSWEGGVTDTYDRSITTMSLLTFPAETCVQDIWVMRIGIEMEAKWNWSARSTHHQLVVCTTVMWYAVQMKLPPARGTWGGSEDRQPKAYGGKPSFECREYACISRKANAYESRKLRSF